MLTKVLDPCQYTSLAINTFTVIEAQQEKKYPQESVLKTDRIARESNSTQVMLLHCRRTHKLYQDGLSYQRLLGYIAKARCSLPTDQ